MIEKMTNVTNEYMRRCTVSDRLARAFQVILLIFTLILYISVQ